MLYRFSQIFPAIAALAMVASPVAARDHWGDQRGGYGYNDNRGEARQVMALFRDLQRDFEHARRSGRMNKNEVSRINRQIRSIDQKGDRYARNGFTRQETNQLRRDIQNSRRDLNRAVASERRHDGRDRHDRYERGDRDSRYYRN